MELGEIRTWKFEKVERCCYADLIANFYKEKEEEFINQLKLTFFDSYSLDLSDEQIHAWRDSFNVMQSMNTHLMLAFFLSILFLMNLEEGLTYCYYQMSMLLFLNLK